MAFDINSAANDLSPTGELFASAAEKYGRGDPALFARILSGQYSVESTNGTNTDHKMPGNGAKSPAQGPMGLVPAVQRKYGVSDPNDLGQAINAAAQYLSEGYDRTGNFVDALKYYHGGPNRRIWGDYTNAYPTQVASAAGIDPQQLSTPSKTPDWINQAAKDMSPEEKEVAESKQTPVQSPTPTPDQHPNWGPLMEGSNAALFGAGVPLAAGLHSLREGIPFSQAEQELYRQRGAYENENPGTSLGINILGSLPGALGGEQLVAKGLSNLGARVASPALDTLGRFIGGTAGEGTAGLLGRGARLASRITSGAVQGGGVAGATAGLYNHPLGEQMVEGAEMGGLLNPIAAGGHSLLSAPYKAYVDPTIAALTNRVKNLGLDLRGGQITTNPVVREADTKLLASKRNMDQLGDWVQAGSHTFGEDSRTMTPALFDDARDRIGKTLDSIGSRSTFAFDNQALQDLAHLKNTTANKAVLSTIDDLENHVLMNNFSLPGNVYQDLTNYNGTIGRLVKSKVDEVSQGGQDLRDILDSARDRTDPTIGNEWKSARNQWKNMRIYEDLSKKSPAGIPDPKGLQSSVMRYYPQYGTGAGAGPIGDLARVGQLPLFPRPTPEGGLMASKTPHGSLDKLSVLGGISAGASALGEHFLPLFSHVPGASAILEAGLAGGAGAAALGLGKTGLQKFRAGQIGSPEYVNRLLNPNLDKYWINPLIPSVPLSRNAMPQPNSGR